MAKTLLSSSFACLLDGSNTTAASKSILKIIIVNKIKLIRISLLFLLLDMNEILKIFFFFFLIVTPLGF